MRTGLRRLGAGIAVLAVAGWSGCGEEEAGSESDSLFDRDEFGFTFEYPEDFQETESVTKDAQLGADAEASAGVAIEEEDGLFVEQYTLTASVDQANLALVQKELDNLIHAISPRSRAEETEVAGLPALRYDDVTVRTVENGRSRMTFIFDGDAEYLINCQSSTPDLRDEVEEACDMALETFEPK
jgi:hypothetical protein